MKDETRKNFVLTHLYCGAAAAGFHLSSLIFFLYFLMFPGSTKPKWVSASSRSVRLK